jgi:hypothetical protein
VRLPINLPLSIFLREPAGIKIAFQSLRQPNNKILGKEIIKIQKTKAIRKVFFTPFRGMQNQFLRVSWNFFRQKKLRNKKIPIFFVFTDIINERAAGEKKGTLEWTIIKLFHLASLFFL